MDFAADICESCGEQFCEGCFVFPRGPKGPPYCTHCAMALSGVRNRRPVKPLPRGEIKRRRKALKASLSEQEAPAPISMPGTDLINGPELELQDTPVQETSGGIMGRFRRRRTDHPERAVEAGQLFGDEEPIFQTTVAGGRRAEDPELPEGAAAPFPDEDVDTPAVPEHSTATALLNQLRESENGDREDDVWLPASAPVDAPTWSLPDISQQSPLGASGPWGAVATPQSPTDAAVPTEANSVSDLSDAAPVFLTEAQLKAVQRAEGPADKDGSGNWVPPSLRGMDPKAASNGGELTKRRRRPEPAAEQKPEPSADL